MPPVLATSPIALGVGAVFFLVAVGIVAYAVAERRWLAGFGDRAVTVDGRIERLKATTSSTSSASHRVILRYRAVVSFRLQDGTERMATTRWPTYERPAVGETVRIAYDPERPKRVVPAEGPGSAAPPFWGYLLVAAFAFVLGYVAIVVGETFA